MNTAMQDFDRRHGPDRVLHNGFYYYPSGGRLENCPMGLMAEPSDDPHQRLKDIALYHDLAMTVERESFDRHKAACGSNPTPAQVQELKRLRDAVLARRAKLQEVTEELHQASPRAQYWRESVARYEARLSAMSEDDANYERIASKLRCARANLYRAETGQLHPDVERAQIETRHAARRRAEEVKAIEV